MARFYSLGELAREDARLGSALERGRRRLGELLRRPLQDAKAAGALRRDLTLEDVFLLIAMVKGAMDGGDGPAGRAAVGSRALTLLLDGLTSSRPPA